METTERKRGFLFSVISYVSLVSYNSIKKGAKRKPNFYNKYVKKSTLLIIIFVFLANCSQDSLANDSEKNWCIGKLSRIDYLVLMVPKTDDRTLVTEFTDTVSNLSAAIEIYNNDNDPTDESTSGLKNNLLSNDQEALRLCKIWTDISLYNE
jgi:hypothetical protein